MRQGAHVIGAMVPNAGGGTRQPGIQAAGRVAPDSGLNGKRPRECAPSLLCGKIAPSPGFGPAIPPSSHGPFALRPRSRHSVFHGKEPGRRGHLRSPAGNAQNAPGTCRVGCMGLFHHWLGLFLGILIFLETAFQKHETKRKHLRSLRPNTASSILVNPFHPRTHPHARTLCVCFSHRTVCT